MRFSRIGTSALILALACCSCAAGAGRPEQPAADGLVVHGSGKVVRQSRAVAGFNSVSLSGIGDLRIVPGPEEMLLIEAEENLASLVRVDVQGGALSIRYGNEWNEVSVAPTRPVRLTLVARDLSVISLTGKGTVDVSEMKLRSVSVRIMGEGTAVVWVTDSLRATIAGRGTIRYYGNPAVSRRIMGLGVVAPLGDRPAS
jgi:hypothetical protein